MARSYVQPRRAIEALRAGVPNRDAVLALGSTQPRIVEKFARQLESALDDIPGIGAKRRQALLKYFGSVDKMKQASVEELARAPGMTRPVAEQVRAALAPPAGAERAA